MTRFGRSLVAAAVCVLAAHVAQAQTVMVRNAPQGASIELRFNDASVATVAAKPGAETSVALPAMAGGAKATTDLRFWVDFCDTTRRVFVMENGLFPAPKDVGCDRKEISGIYLAKPTTTFVLDLSGTSPSIWLRQGPVPSAWLGAGPIIGPSGEGLQPRTGLLVGGGVGLSTITELSLVQCGNFTGCSGAGPILTWEAGATLWAYPFLGVEFNYHKASTQTLTGSESPIIFSTNFDANLMRIVGKAGPLLGPARFYVLAGDNYHRATVTTTETVADRTVTLADGTSTVIKGGTQVITMQTSGWGLTVGGGAEIWVNPRFLIYGEATRNWMKGWTTDNTGIQMDDRKWSFMLGARFRIGRH